MNLIQCFFNRSIPVSLILVIGFLFPSGLTASEGKTPDPKIIERTLKELTIMKDLAAPGENHKHLKYFIGKWKSTVKLWIEAGAAPIAYTQDITVKPLLEGRMTYAVLQSDILGVRSDMIVITGFDNLKKEFYQLSFSDLGTTYTTSTGTLDKTGKIRTEKGYFEDNATGEKSTLKSITTLIDNHHYTYELYVIDPRGHETKSMEVSYTRTQ